MIYKGYKATIEYDDSIGFFHGSVWMDGSGATFEATDVEGLKREMALSMEDYFEACTEQGKSPKPPESSHNPPPLPEEDWENIMSSNNHAARLHFDEECEVFIGQLNIDSRAHTFQGTSVADLKHALAQLVDAHASAHEPEKKAA